MVQRASELLNSFGQRDIVRRIEQLQQTVKNSADNYDAASSIGLAQDAVRSYHRDDRITGDAAMCKLRQMQQEDGSFCSAPDDQAAERHRITTVMSFLEAAQLQVEAGFAANDAVYETINPSDARAMAVRDWFMANNNQSQVADIGCGRGRYLKLLTPLAIAEQLVGIDPTESCLAELPPEIEARHGSLLNIPASNGEFAAAFAVESLEHCLAPQSAIEELCRVVCPGGHVLIIDKHARYQPLSEHQPWERWFHPEEVCHWLTRHCDAVSCTPLAQHEHRRGRETFLAWYGRRIESDA